jgi:hypothetical protein
MRLFLVVCMFIAVVLFSTVSHADPVRKYESEHGYGYDFEDDPLNAGGFGPNDSTLIVRPGPVRTTLIRPRTSFVAELLKSVESI